jgi:hypothetical protein
MAEEAAPYYGYVAPVAAQESYADALQKRVALIQEQQKANIAQIVESQERKNEFRLKQLESLYGFKTNGWGDQPIQIFNEVRGQVADKLKNSQYTSIEDFYRDIGNVSNMHGYFSNHYETVKPVLQETMKYMQAPGLYPDKTKKVTEDLSTYTHKADMAQNMGIDGWTVAEDGSVMVEYNGLGATGQMPLFDIPIAANPAPFLPQIDWNYIAPLELSTQYSPLATRAVNESDTGKSFAARVKPEIIASVSNDEALSASAKMYYEQTMGTSVVDAPGKDPNEVYAESYADAVLAPFLNMRKTYAPRSATAPRSTGTTKPPALSFVNAQVEQVEIPLSQPEKEQRGLGIFNRAPKTQTGYNYSLPNISEEKAATAGINLSQYVNSEIRDQLAGKVTVVPKNITFLSDRMIIKNATSSDGTDIGDVTVPYNTDAARDIEGLLKLVYGGNLALSDWSSGRVYQTLTGFQTPTSQEGGGGQKMFFTSQGAVRK